MRSPKDQTLPRIMRRDPTAAAKLLDGFMSLGRGPDLAALAAEPGANTGALADDIVAAWYCLQPWATWRPASPRPAPRMSASSACSAHASSAWFEPQGRRPYDRNGAHGRRSEACGGRSRPA